MLSGSHVVLSGGVQRLSVACSVPGFHMNKVYFSRPVASQSFGFIFAKRRSPIVERFYKAYSWALQFRWLEHYGDKVQGGANRENN